MASIAYAQMSAPFRTKQRMTSPNVGWTNMISHTRNAVEAAPNNDKWQTCLWDVHLEKGERFEQVYILETAPPASCIGVIDALPCHAQFVEGLSLADLGWCLKYADDGPSTVCPKGTANAEKLRCPPLQDGSRVVVLVDLMIGLIEIRVDDEVCARLTDVKPREYPVIFGCSFLGGSGKIAALEPIPLPIPHSQELLYPEQDWNDLHGSIEDLMQDLTTYLAPFVDGTDYRVKHLNILAMGVPGAGKTSWINSVFTAPSKRIRRVGIAGVCNGDGTMTKTLNTYRPFEQGIKVSNDRTPIHLVDTAGVRAGTYDNGQFKLLLAGQLHDGAILETNASGPTDGLQAYHYTPEDVDNQAHVVVLLFPFNKLNDAKAIDQIRDLIDVTRMSHLNIPVIVQLTMIDQYYPEIIRDPQGTLSAALPPKIKSLISTASYQLGLPPRDILIQLNYHERNSKDATIDLLTLANLKILVDTATDYMSGPVFSRRVRSQNRHQDADQEGICIPLAPADSAQYKIPPHAA